GGGSREAPRRQLLGRRHRCANEPEDWNAHRPACADHDPLILQLVTNERSLLRTDLDLACLCPTRDQVAIVARSHVVAGKLEDGIASIGDHLEIERELAE